MKEFGIYIWVPLQDILLCIYAEIPKSKNITNLKPLNPSIWGRDNLSSPTVRLYAIYTDTSLPLFIFSLFSSVQ